MFCTDIEIVRFADYQCTLITFITRDELRENIIKQLTKANYWLSVNNLSNRLNTDRIKTLKGQQG